MSNIQKNPKILNTKKSHNTNEISNPNENGDSNIYNLDNNEVLDNLIKLSGNEEVYKELKEETGKIKRLLSQSKEKLSNINLYEKQRDDIDIYQWNNLFNRSIPITAYVASSSYIKKQIKKKEKEENKNASETKEEKDSIKHPIILVDLTNEEMKKYLPPEPIGAQAPNVIRFQQLPFKGDSNNVFYFSNAFNDYYKMDFKKFTEIMPVLKAKKRCESARLTRQIKETKKFFKNEEKTKEYINREMSNRLNNLYIEQQYISLSKKSKNIQPLMSSIRAQIYPGKGDDLTKNSKLYFKSNKPLGSERDRNSIDYSINERDYQRNELHRIRSTKKRPKSTIKDKLHLSKYDINDPDVAIFRKLEIFEENNNDEENNINDKKNLLENQEKYLIDSERYSKEIEPIKNINNKEGFSILDESQSIQNNNKNYKLIQRKIKSANIRALSAKRNYLRNKEALENNRNSLKYKRAMSAHPSALAIRNTKPYIHNVYLSSKNRMVHSAFYKKKYPTGNQFMNEKFDDKYKGNSSSQISTYEGINNSLYENSSAQKYGFPFRTNHQVQSKIYQKINKRLKERQYEKDKQKLEEFSKLIHLDDVFMLSNDFYKDKFNKSNNVIGNIPKNIFSTDKNKSINRPLSSYQTKPGRNTINYQRKILSNQNKPLTPKLLRYSKTKHPSNFRAISKKSSNENSKLDFTTSVLNTKHEYLFNSNNDKVTFIYFNDVIENKPQTINEGKPIIKNDRIIVGANYYNRAKPQLLNQKSNFRNTRTLRRVQSSKNYSYANKQKNNNVIIQEENL